MVKVICGWCREEFNMKYPYKGKYGYGHQMCPHCLRDVKSSKRIKVGGRNIREQFKAGDVV